MRIALQGFQVSASYLPSVVFVFNKHRGLLEIMKFGDALDFVSCLDHLSLNSNLRLLPFLCTFYHTVWLHVLFKTLTITSPSNCFYTAAALVGKLLACPGWLAECILNYWVYTWHLDDRPSFKVETTPPRPTCFGWMCRETGWLLLIMYCTTHGVLLYVFL